MDIVLLVLESERTGQQMAAKASALMQESRAKVATVLNKYRRHVPAALAQELAGREPLPLVLDDPTAHFDEDRRGVLLGYLEELAKDIQVVLMTHDRRVLNQIREAHVLTIGTESHTSDSARKIDIRP